MHLVQGPFDVSSSLRARGSCRELEGRKADPVLGGVDSWSTQSGLAIYTIKYKYLLTSAVHV
jgi:hypothetical protein